MPPRPPEPPPPATGPILVSGRRRARPGGRRRRRRPACSCQPPRRPIGELLEIYPARAMVGEDVVWTTPMVNDCMRRTSSLFKAIDEDWARAEKEGVARPDQLKRWRALRDDWKAFQQSIKDSWVDAAAVMAPLASRTATVERIDHYRAELNTWAKRAAKVLKPLGVKTTPGPRPCKGSSAKAWWSEVGHDISVALVVAGATALVVTLFGGRRGGQ